MNKGLVIFGLLIIIAFVIFKYVIVPMIVAEIQREAEKYIGPFKSLVTLENLKTLCGLTEATVPILGIPIPIKPIVGIVSPEILEKCNQLSTLMQILALEIYVYFVGFILLVVGLAIGGRKEVIREVIREKRHEKEPEEEEETPKKRVKKKGVRYCYYCGGEIKRGEKFCGSCGKKVKK